MYSHQTQISELTDGILQYKANTTNNITANENIISIQFDENKSLKQELKHVCDQLAQRTILYAAQERRWLQDYRISKNTSGNLNNELIEIKSKLEIMEQKYTELDHERIQLVLQNKELYTQNENLIIQTTNLTNKNIELEKDISNNLALTIDLQATINRLRNSDYDSIERDLTFEFEKLKREFNMKDEIFKQQTEELKLHITKLSEKNDVLINQIYAMSQEVELKNNLLLEYNQIYQSDNNRKHINIVNENHNHPAVSSVGISYTMVSNTSDDTINVSDSHNNMNATSTNIINEVFNTNDVNTNTNITEQYLVGGDDNKIEQESSTNYEINILKEEIKFLKFELTAANDRERKQKSKLAMVLRKASEISDSNPNNNNNHHHSFDTLYTTDMMIDNEQFIDNDQNVKTESMVATIESQKFALQQVKLLLKEKSDEISKLQLDRDNMLESLKQSSYLNDDLKLLSDQISQSSDSNILNRLSNSKYNELLHEYQQLKASINSNTMANGINVILNNDKIEQIFLYPEMLSPDDTLRIVKSIASRSYSVEDFIEIYEKAKSI